MSKERPRAALLIMGLIARLEALARQNLRCYVEIIPFAGHVILGWIKITNTSTTNIWNTRLYIKAIQVDQNRFPKGRHVGSWLKKTSKYIAHRFLEPYTDNSLRKNDKIK